MATVRNIGSVKQNEYEVEFSHKGTVYNVKYALDLTRTSSSGFMTIPPVTAHINHGKMAAAVFVSCGVKPGRKLFEAVREALAKEVPATIEF